MTLLLARNRNYRLLFTASAMTNLGDGLIVLALPWLATLMTRDPIAIGAVAAATRLPWLLFALPAGVIIDRSDRRKLMARADLVRAGLMLAVFLLALSPSVPNAVWLLTLLAFLLGSAEVLRDNASQTILPSIVDKDDLEAANGQLWSAEQLTGQFLGPPLAGFLIGLGIAIPFGLDIAFLLASAGLLWLITLRPQSPVMSRFWPALIEGVRYMRQDSPLFRLALVLGASNFLAIMGITVLVLFTQDILGLTATQHGFILSAGAVGAVVGSLCAPRIVQMIGNQISLYIALATWTVGYLIIGIAHSAIVVGAAEAVILATAMLWNVITVSWRQRRIPADLLGRVNSIYRFFGWGSMPLGAMAGGLVVAILEPDLGRELALRAPFLLAAAGALCMTVYALFKLRLD